MTKRHVGAAVFAALLSTPLMLSPAHAQSSPSACQQAVSSDPAVQAVCKTITILGHRGIQGPKAATNENTIWALRKDRDKHVGFETDAWVIKDGTAVIFHDKRLCRVVDRSTLPAGVTCQTPITDLVLSQFQQLRTLGGQPLSTVQRWLRKAGEWGVFGIIENKYTMLNAPGVAAMIEHYHANVAIYQTPKCGPHGLIHAEFVDYGVPTGAKYLGACKPTVEEMANGGYSFVITGGARITPAYVDEVHHYGMKIGNFDSGDPIVWTQLVNSKADYIIAPHPSRTNHWRR